MSAKPQDIEGPIVITGSAQAKPGRADELAQWFANLKARADSDLEPGTLTYRMFRLGESFTFHEEYADHEALRKHVKENPLFVEFTKVQDEITEPATPVFWPARSLPEPTIRPQN